MTNMDIVLIVLYFAVLGMVSAIFIAGIIYDNFWGPKGGW